MNKKFYGTLLLGTLLLGSTIVSCKDYDDDIDNLQNQITQLATKADMQSEVSKLQSAVATAQAAAENKAAAAEQAAKDAAAKAQAAADAAAKAQGTADAAATVEALEKVAAEAAAAAKAAEEAKVAAEAKAAELASQLAELQALAATLVSTEDFEAAKKELNDKYAELAAKIGETTGVTGMTGINLVGANNAIAAGYGVWAGVHNNMEAVEWDGPKAETINAIEKGKKLAAWGVNNLTFSVNPTDFDASSIEAFAIVNQFDEVAPIAFGTPKAVTRAAAGAWTLPVLGSVIYGDKAVEFEKNFKPANNQDGTVATLAAGQFAGALSANFCTVTKNENTNATTFSKEIALDEIDGTAALVADNGSVVLDAYITGLKTTFDSNVAHDSVVYKLAYTGTTLTYDAEAVKKYMSKHTGNKTITVDVKQINLNGYIHTMTGTITFKGKEAPKPIVFERLQLANAPHTIVPIVWDKSQGKDVNNQKLTVSILPALKKWGIDLSKTTDEATIHWNHTTFTKVEVIEDSVYYLKNDQTPVYLTNFVDTVGLSGEAKDKKQNADLTIVFKKNYAYDNVKKVNDAVVTNLKDGVDAAFNGKLIYVPVKMTGKDIDNDESKEVVYSVVVPVQFNKINIQDYYEWNEGKAIKIQNSALSTSTELSRLFTSTATTGDANTAIIKLAKPTFTAKDEDGNNPAVSKKAIAYYAPSVTVSGQLTGDAYIKALAKMQEDGYDDEDDKTSREAELARITNHAAYVILGSSTRSYQGYVDVSATATPNYKLAVTSDNYRTAKATTAPTGIDEKFYFDITYPRGASANVQKYITSVYENRLINAKYTINGLTAEIMDRKHVALGGLEVEVYSAATSAYTVELSDNKIYNDAAAPTMFFANKEWAPVTAWTGKFSKTFSVSGKYGPYDVKVSGAIAPTSVKYVFADGTVKTSASRTPNITVNGVAYDIDEKTSPTQKLGLSFNVRSAAETFTIDGNTVPVTKAVKILVTLPSNAFGLTSDYSKEPTENITFEFEVAE